MAKAIESLVLWVDFLHQREYTGTILCMMLVDNLLMKLMIVIIVMMFVL